MVIQYGDSMVILKWNYEWNMNGICIDIYLHADMGYIGDMLMEYEWKHGGIMVGYYGDTMVIFERIYNRIINGIRTGYQWNVDGIFMEYYIMEYLCLGMWC
jgi:hypothetical protein